MKQPKQTQLIVTEGVSGVYHYHLSLAEGRGFVRGLCGSPTMQTCIPLSDWGQKGGEHLPKRYTYCKTCEKKAQEIKEKEPSS